MLRFPCIGLQGHEEWTWFNENVGEDEKNLAAFACGCIASPSVPFAPN